MNVCDTNITNGVRKLFFLLKAAEVWTGLATLSEHNWDVVCDC